MVDGIRRLLTVALAAGLISGLSWGGQAQAQETQETQDAAVTTQAEPSGSVLRLARGLASDDITVLIGRAIVVESTQPFIEVSVADPNIADVSPLSDRSIYIFGKNRGATSLTLLGENGELITNVTVKVIPDLSEMKSHLRRMLPNEPIEARLSGGGVVLSGVVSGAKKVSRAMELARSYVGDGAINMMTVGGAQQVMLKVRVAEMRRDAGKSLGIDFGVLGEGGDVSGMVGSGANQEGAVGQGGAAVGQTQDSITVGTLEAVTDSFGAIGVVAQLGDIAIDALLSAGEQKGFSRTLAEPNLVALSGTTASFLAGEEVPIPTVDSDGQTDIEFKEVGVNVDFTPSVLDDDVINLQLATEVSALSTTSPGQISFAVNNINTTFTTRRASTTIQLRDGESFAIAGLIEDNFTDSVAQFPWLGDIPILGTLFRSADYARNETELVIIVTAHLVTAVTEDELALPSDHVRIPNEFEIFLQGRTEVGGAPGMVQSKGFDGDFGYVVE